MVPEIAKPICWHNLDVWVFLGATQSLQRSISKLHLVAVYSVLCTTFTIYTFAVFLDLHQPFIGIVIIVKFCHFFSTTDFAYCFTMHECVLLGVVVMIDKL